MNFNVKICRTKRSTAIAVQFVPFGSVLLVSYLEEMILHKCNLKVYI